MSTERWIRDIIQRENKQLGFIDYIFCTDEYLLKINQDYLDHDTLTDIITFNYNEDDSVNADIFISIDRVRENAKKHNQLFEDELDRVLIHGVLHLVGYNDKSEEEKEIMRKKEQECLTLRQ